MRNTLALLKNLLSSLSGREIQKKIHIYCCIDIVEIALILRIF